MLQELQFEVLSRLEASTEEGRRTDDDGAGEGKWKRMCVSDREGPSGEGTTPKQMEHDVQTKQDVGRDQRKEVFRSINRLR